MTLVRKTRRFGILLAIFLFGPATWAMAQAKYMAPEVAAADNFKPPWNSTASGIVVLDVLLDATETTRRRARRESSRISS